MDRTALVRPVRASWGSGDRPLSEVDAAVPFRGQPMIGDIVLIEGRRSRVVRIGRTGRFPDYHLQPGEVPVHLTVQAEDEPSPTP